MTFLGQRLLPRRRGESSLMDRFKIQDYLTELVITPKSPLAGKRLDEIDVEPEIDLNILGIIRGKSKVLIPLPQERIKEGDLLLVEIHPQDLGRLSSQAGLEIVPGVEPGEARHQFRRY